MDFKQALDALKGLGFAPIPETVSIKIPNSVDLLHRGIKYFTGNKARWLPEYEEFAQWLTDNQGRGLICYGNCGRGKTLLCGKVLPILIHHFTGRILNCYTSQELNNDADRIMKHHLIYIDDIGIENESVKYGERRLVFPELVDMAEKKGKLLIISTNLRLDELASKYGERTIDRLKAITKTINFKGKSLRQ